MDSKINLDRLLNTLPEPKNKIEEIAYQTILPYYDPEILNEYNKVVPGSGERLWQMIKMEIQTIKESKKALGKSEKEWMRHAGKMGWNVSGKYKKEI